MPTHTSPSAPTSATAPPLCGCCPRRCGFSPPRPRGSAVPPFLRRSGGGPPASRRTSSPAAETRHHPRPRRPIGTLFWCSTSSGVSARAREPNAPRTLDPDLLLYDRLGARRPTRCCRIRDGTNCGSCWNRWAETAPERGSSTVPRGFGAELWEHSPIKPSRCNGWALNPNTPPTHHPPPLPGRRPPEEKKGDKKKQERVENVVPVCSPHFTLLLRRPGLAPPPWSSFHRVHTAVRSP